MYDGQGFLTSRIGECLLTPAVNVGFPLATAPGSIDSGGREVYINIIKTPEKAELFRVTGIELSLQDQSGYLIPRFYFMVLPPLGRR